MSNVALKKFVNNVCSIYFSGKATEGSYYSVLKSSFEEYAKAKGINAEVIVQPKRSEGGMPDMLLRSNGSIIGHIEVKDIPQNLDEIERTKQLTQYKQAYPNLILTDLFSFVLFREGTRKSNVILANKNSLLFSNIVPKLSHIQEVEALLDEFLSYGTPETFTAQELATELAKRAKQLNNNVIMELENNNKQLQRIYESIRKQLLPSLTKEYFADMYAQTLTYGLFFSRVQAGPNEFNRINAYSYIPNNIPLLERLFYLMQDPRLIENIKWILDDIVAVLNKANIESVVKNLHAISWSEDPVIHFYETFLQVYNPKEREHLGVYYTPAPVVAYIMSSIHEFLITKFQKQDGLADKSVTLLDPASGTLTFPIMGIKLCYRIYEQSGKAGSFPSLVQDHILKNFYAFELLLAPYVIGHFKATLALQDLGYSIKDERFQLYLTNALELETSSSQDTIFPELNTEERDAVKVKEEPILVIVGNPPYSVSSDNKSKFIEKLMSDYKVNLENERNIQPLSDDYIKFLRLANWKIAENSCNGIVGMITNNAYLDGLIHRTIRQKLLDDFSSIFILNLHGNSRSQERAPDGSKDDNVFDIQQGVAIIFLIKTQENEKSIYYKDVWGDRESKYQWLLSHHALETDWIKLTPESPNYWFIPNPDTGIYTKFPLLSDLMPFHRQGVKTHRDWLVIGLKSNEIIAKLNSLRSSSEDEFLLSMHWNENDKPIVTHAKKLLSNLPEIIDKKIIKYCYRPFDDRYLYYDDKLLDRPRPELFKQLGSLFLVTRSNSRQWPGTWSFAHVTKEMPDIDMRGGVYAFPLLVDKKPNFSPEFLSWALFHFGESDPMLLFSYIYAILYSKKYRAKYSSALRTSYPRIPLTASKDLFVKMSSIGKELIDLHLLTSSKIHDSMAGFPETGTDIINKVSFNSLQSIVNINETQFFSKVEQAVWDFEVGGYKICEKWLKNRIGRKLESDDQLAFMKLVAAIKETINLQTEIDKLYPDIESNLSAFSNSKYQQSLEPAQFA